MQTSAIQELQSTLMREAKIFPEVGPKNFRIILYEYYMIYKYIYLLGSPCIHLHVYIILHTQCFFESRQPMATTNAQSKGKDTMGSNSFNAQGYPISWRHQQIHHHSQRPLGRKGDVIGFLRSKPFKSDVLNISASGGRCSCQWGLLYHPKAIVTSTCSASEKMNNFMANLRYPAQKQKHTGFQHICQCL